ncbi:flotillin-1-like [Sycon ciliatum]|uniref:flotillin-1-like n=1 Tax=Sycon ciliatum TaxID=27933 RepID=UPI0020ADDF5D|eukprot:scpid57778/ scgid29629/ Flotillin-1
MPGWETCGPNECMVVSGCCHSPPLMVPGGRVFVWPYIQKVQKLSLNTLTLTIDSNKVYTKLGVPISVIGIAQVKIQSNNRDMLATACQQFLGKPPSVVQDIVLQTLEGHQRAIMGTMTVEEIYSDRQKFSNQVFETASADFVNMGISIISYTMRDVHDDIGYLSALGKARTAEVKRDAQIGEASAARDSGIKSARAEQQQLASQFENDIEVARAQRDFDLKKAAYDREVNTKKAESDLAHSLQTAKTRQQIEEEKMQVKVIERQQAISVQDQEIQRRQRELEASVKKPADATRYKMQTLAEAERKRIVLEAEAEAEAIRVRGEAEAFAIEAKASAEAEQMAKKADAWKEYQDAAMVDMVLETLPKVVAEVSAPLAKAKHVVMISGGDGEIGAAKMTKEVLDIVNLLPETVQRLTGVDVSKVIKATA